MEDTASLKEQQVIQMDDIFISHYSITETFTELTQENGL
jgi:hypothetical protein